VFASAIYWFEPRSNIESLQQAVWLTIVTMTTVGYGDVSPESTEGYFLVSILIISSALYMAIPLGIVGNAFSKVWEDRDRLLLMQRTRGRILQGGYSAQDIPELFKLFASKDGHLTLAMFRKMLQQMRIGFSEPRIVELFKSFDNDGSGTVECEEFVRALFPGAFAEIYGGMGGMNRAPRHFEDFRNSLERGWQVIQEGVMSLPHYAQQTSVGVHPFMHREEQRGDEATKTPHPAEDPLRPEERSQETTKIPNPAEDPLSPSGSAS